MKLDQVTLEIRPRSAWEALDLGVLMARSWWAPMMKAWLIASLPVLFIALIIPTEEWWISAFLLWWLKPVYERPLLHIVSRAVFNDLPSTRATLKLFPSLAFKQLFLSLTWRRLSPTRSLDLPVLQLEGLSGARRQQRLRVLHREDSAPAGWITVLGSILEVCLWFGLLIVLWALIPRDLNIEWAGLFFDTEHADLAELKIILWYCALGMSAPFYTACGFALYLNRRIRLEAWDIEIAFRRIVNKRGSTYQSTLASLMGAVFFLGACALLTNAPAAMADDRLPVIEAIDILTDEGVADASTGEYLELNRQSARAAIEEVVRQSDFSRKEISRELKWKETELDYEFWANVIETLRSFDDFTAAATVLEVLLWLVCLALIAVVTYRYRYWLAAQFVRIKPQPALIESPMTLFGMDVTHKSLPHDISDSALALFHQGDMRASLALLYRASLSQLIQRGVTIHDGHTESECVQLMHIQNNIAASTKAMFSSGQMQYFAHLTRSWQQLAYGHVQPDDAVVQQLCTGWNVHWLTTKSRDTGK